MKSTEVVYGEHILHKAQVHVVLDLYDRYALSYKISDTETSSSVIEAFNRAFKVETDARSIRIVKQHTVQVCLTIT